MPLCVDLSAVSAANAYAMNTMRSISGLANGASMHTVAGMKLHTSALVGCSVSAAGYPCAADTALSTLHLSAYLPLSMLLLLPLRLC
jgi:hypothetical protein